MDKRDHFYCGSTPNSFGFVNDDGMDHVRVYVGEHAQPRSVSINACTLIKFRVERSIGACERVQWRISFYYPNVVTNLSPESAQKVLSCQLDYFSGDNHQEEVEQIGLANWIPIDVVGDHQLGSDQTRRGGFSILLYAPPNFAKADGFAHATERLDPIQQSGKPGPKRVKLVWQLWKICRENGDSTTIANDSHIVLNGTFVQRDDGSVLRTIQASVQDLPARVESLEQQLRLQGSIIDGQVEVIKGQSNEIRRQKSEVRLATWVAVFSIVIAIVFLDPFRDACDFFLGWTRHPRIYGTLLFASLVLAGTALSERLTNAWHNLTRRRNHHSDEPPT